MRKLFSCLLPVLFVQSLPAQKKIILEKFRCYNQNIPVNSYLGNPAIRQVIASRLNQTLFTHFTASLADTTDIPVEFLDFNRTVPGIRPDFAGRDTNTLHLYIDFIEAAPYYFFRSKNRYPADSGMVQRARTVFMMEASLLDAGKKIRFNESLDLVINVAETAAIGNLMGRGIQTNELAVTEKTFEELIRTGMDMLLNPANDLSMAELKLQPAFLYDNYLLPKTVNQPRIYTTQNKNITSYRLQNRNELIRFEEPEYEEIRIKGKKAEKYPEALTSAIRLTDDFSGSEYVFLNQPARDVLRNRNYLIKMTTQIDPSNIPMEKELLFTNFLQGNFHYLFLEKDTLACFSVLKDIAEPANKLSRKTIGNGIDTAVRYASPFQLQKAGDWMVVYAYVLNGSLKGLPFRIKCSGAMKNLKEIFVADKLVCIAQGKFYPEKFVLFDASLSPELLNQLFLIGFNRFLE